MLMTMMTMVVVWAVRKFVGFFFRLLASVWLACKYIAHWRARVQTKQQQQLRQQQGVLLV